MRLLRASAVVAAALAPALVLTARAQDDSKKPRPENQVFKEAKQDAEEKFVQEIRFKDVSYRVSEDPDIRKKVSQVALFLEPNALVIVYLVGGEIVGIEKGQIKNAIDTLPPGLQKSIKESAEDDEVQITTGREVVGKIRKIRDDDLKLLPAVKLSKPLEAGKNTYDVNGSEITVPFKDMKRFVNLTRIKKQQNPNAPQVANDAVSRQDLQVGDTVKIVFNYGQIAQLTPDTLVLNEWKQDSFGDPITYPRDKLGEVIFAPLPRTRKYPVNGGGEIELKEEKQREGRKNLLTLRGTVWHDQKEFILVGAQLVFSAGPAGTNVDQTPAFREEIPVPPIFYGGDDPWKKEKALEQFDGQVTLYFDPAKNMISARTREALPHIVAALATSGDGGPVARVLNAAALNGDPELAILLVARHANVASGPDQPKQQAMILEALQRFGEAGARAVVEHLRTGDAGYSIPIAREDGTIGHKDQKEQAVTWKKYELKILADLPGAAAGMRGRALFDMYEERSGELGEAIVKVFQARTSESIDALLDVAVSVGGRPTPDEAKRTEDAAGLIRMLGEPGFNELVLRVKAINEHGPVAAKNLQVKKDSGQTPLPELIQDAIRRLVDAKLAERKQALGRTLDEARTKITAKDWEGALKIVEDVLSKDRDMDDARKLLYDCLVRVAELRMSQKKRGEAALLLHRVIDDNQLGRGAEAMLAKILVEAAREDLDGNCIRKEPDEASEVVKRCNKGDILKVASVKIAAEASWYPIRLNEKGDYGWINRDSVDPAGDGSQCGVHGDSMKPDNIRATLALVRKYSAERGPEADLVDGELWIRDAKQKYADGQYAAAYASFQKAREFVPTDPALGDAWKCWVFANGFLLLIFGGVLVVALVASILVLRNRQKRVHVAEFKYYGKDRVRVEREIDGASTAAPSADAPAPAPSDQPSDAAPPA